MNTTSLTFTRFAAALLVFTFHFGQKTAPFNLPYISSFIKKLKNFKKSGEFLVVGNNHADEWIKSDFKKEKKLIDALKVFFTKDLIKKKFTFILLKLKMSLIEATSKKLLKEYKK